MSPATAQLDILVNIDTTDGWFLLRLGDVKEQTGGSSSHGEYEDFDWGQVSLNIKETSSLHRYKIPPEVSRCRLHTLPNAYARITDSELQLSMLFALTQVSCFHIFIPTCVGSSCLGLLLE